VYIVLTEKKQKIKSTQILLFWSILSFLALSGVAIKFTDLLTNQPGNFFETALADWWGLSIPAIILLLYRINCLKKSVR
jgi:hypothetical protein